MAYAMMRRHILGVLQRNVGITCRNESVEAVTKRPHITASTDVYECATPDLRKLAQREMIVIEDFINENEEELLLKDIEPKWRRLRYQFDHWDNAIQGYREKEISTWSNESLGILQRLRETAFSEEDQQRTLVHVLDLAQDGFIKPHVDSVKFCGRVIAGLSLISSSVMRLVHEKDTLKYFSALLKRRSLYIMKDTVRYEYTHEILKNEESFFRGIEIPKGRRISVICRSNPESVTNADPQELFKTNVVSLDND